MLTTKGLRELQIHYRQKICAQRWHPSSLQCVFATSAVCYLMVVHPEQKEQKMPGLQVNMTSACNCHGKRQPLSLDRIPSQQSCCSILKATASACFKLEILLSWGMVLRVYKCVSKREINRELCFPATVFLLLHVFQKHLSIIQTGWKFFSSFGTNLILPLAWRGIGEGGLGLKSFIFSLPLPS